MKGSCTLLASVLAASTMAFSSSSSSSANGDRDLALYHPPPPPSSPQGFASESSANRGCGSDPSTEKEKFTPRFDGLRFIETLVTAHR